MNKRVLIFSIMLTALLFSAVSPWPTVLQVLNNTGDNIYITLKYRGEQKYFLTATHAGNSEVFNLSVFDIVRRTYSAQVTACDNTTVWGRMNLNSNLRLNFTVCESMKQWWTPKYWGEPGMEKPNFWINAAGDGDASPPDMGWWGSLNYKNPDPPFYVDIDGEFCDVQNGTTNPNSGDERKYFCSYKRAFRFMYDMVP